jgi:hypothetical protein
MTSLQLTATLLSLSIPAASTGGVLSWDHPYRSYVFLSHAIEQDVQTVDKLCLSMCLAGDRKLQYRVFDLDLTFACR